MSTFFSLRNPMTKEEMKNIGVKFQDGVLDDKPKTWIVEKENTNYLHPAFDSDGVIYGFTRYGGNNANYLLDILDDNGIEWCSEYDLDDCYPMHDIASELGIDIEDEYFYDEFCDIVYDEWYGLDYYWEMKDGNGQKYIEDWCKENKDNVLSELAKL